MTPTKYIPEAMLLIYRPLNEYYQIHSSFPSLDHIFRSCDTEKVFKIELIVCLCVIILYVVDVIYMYYDLIIP